ncbi:protein FAM47E isoform X2 [Castor canadensis]|uniref:Protein FAM47E isoform X2 n=1 Tax=Castor canadensis TaxID=51338 RepID=A0AC58JZS5_CASCN
MNGARRYREHLSSTWFTKHNRLKFPGALQGQRWVFVREGLGDFRNGWPPCHGLITQGPNEAFLPWIHHRAPQPAPKKRQSKLRKEAALSSKLSLVQQAQKALIEDMEGHLVAHPLALYPHLEEALPVELLLKVLEALDPERKLEDAWAYCQDTGKRMKESTKRCSTQVCLELPKKTPVSHSGQWIYKEKPSKMDLLQEDGLFLHENVRKGVRDFCNWAATFGSLDIDEEFILEQFNTDCQNKPNSDVLHVLRLNQVPLELKKNVQLSKLQEAEFFQKPDHERKFQKPQNSHKPKWVKMRYGAWYLNTNLWKRQRADEPLVDPKVAWKAHTKDFEKELQAQFLEKMYIGKKGKSEYNKTPKKLSQA